MLPSNISPHCHGLASCLWQPVASPVFPFPVELHCTPRFFTSLCFHQPSCDEGTCVCFPREDAVWEFLQPFYPGVRLGGLRERAHEIALNTDRGRSGALCWFTPPYVFPITPLEPPPFASSWTMLSSHLLLFTSYYPILEGWVLLWLLEVCYPMGVPFSVGVCI